MTNLPVTKPRHEQHEVDGEGMLRLKRVERVARTFDAVEELDADGAGIVLHGASQHSLEHRRRSVHAQDVRVEACTPQT